MEQKKNEMNVNPQKSKAVHFRPKSFQQTNTTFMVGETVLEIQSNYVYLGLMFTEHLDFNMMAKHVSKSANRALGLVISKYKALGGLPFNTFSKLYESIVDSTINYGAAIWGGKRFSCIEAVQHRAIRFFMGVGRYTPNAAVTGDSGWLSQEIKQWSSVVNQWYRIRAMDEGRINARVFQWAALQNSERCNNWCFWVQKQFNLSGFPNLLCDININEINTQNVKSKIQETLFNNLLKQWNEDLNRTNSRNSTSTGGNTLRTYRTFKNTFETEAYLKIQLPKAHRRAYAKFRCGVAPLRIETGRYERLQLHQRTCFHCNNCIETEVHVLLSCPLYDDIRYKLFIEISNFCDLDALNDIDKLSVILGSNISNVITISAKACYEILTRRRGFLYK